MNTNNKIFAGIVLASLLGVSTLSYVNAASSTSGTGVTKEQIKALFEKQKAGTTLTVDEQALLDSTKAKFGGKGKGDRGPRGFGGGLGEQLTDTEKTALESMTDAQKQEFFDKKRTESEAKREAKENVIDKVLNGETLTADEQTILTTIKTERAAQKVEKEKRKAEMEAIKSILEKQKAGTTLTADEQAKLDAFKASHPKGDKGGREGGKGPKGTASTTTTQ